MPKINRPPAYRHKKSRNLAVVTLNGRDFYLGPWNSVRSRAEYDRLVVEWISNGRQLPPKGSELTITELVAQYWCYAKSYYGRGHEVLPRRHLPPRRQPGR